MHENLNLPGARARFLKNAGARAGVVEPGLKFDQLQNLEQPKHGPYMVLSNLLFLNLNQYTRR